MVLFLIDKGADISTLSNKIRKTVLFMIEKGANK